MRVLWLSQLLPVPAIGGLRQRSFHLMKQVGQQYELHIRGLQRRPYQPDDESLASALTTLGSFAASVEAFPADWEESASHRSLAALRTLSGSLCYDAARFESRSMEKALGELATNERFDVVHIDTVGLAALGRFFPDTPKVLNHHNVESHMMLRRAEREGGLRAPLIRYLARGLASWERRYAADFDCHTMVSRLDAERLCEAIPSARTAVVPNGVDTEYFDLPENEVDDNREIILIGGMGWYPNRAAAEHFLAEIWPLILAREPNAQVTLIGREPSSRVLRAAEADSRIRVHGFVPDLREAVQRAAVLALPFTDGGGTRLKFLDGLAMRKALVSTSLGAEGVDAEAGRDYLRADSPKDFAEACLRLFREPRLRGELGRNGRKVVESVYDWNVIGESLRGVYHELRESRRSVERS